MVIKQSRLMRTEWWPQPHRREISMYFELDDQAIDATIVPIIMYDEGLGTPSDRETHPENAAFAVFADPNCYINSRVDNMFCELTFSLTSKAIDDNIPAISVSFMPIHTAFKEDYIAIDELSSFEVQDILELQTEATDRQGFPLYAGTDLPEPFANSADVGTSVPGLSVDDSIEGVAFNSGQFYDALHYQTIEGKLKKVQSGLKWLTLTPNRPIAKIRIHQKSKTKRMNEYTFFGLLINVPVTGFFRQVAAAGDITAATNYVRADVKYRYNEWNQDFNFKKV